jgi:hypothetical protein
MSDVQTVPEYQPTKAVWSFYRFLHFVTTRGELNFPSERSAVVDASSRIHKKSKA